LLVVSIYLMLQFKWIGAALFFGLSVATKLLPLVVLPLFYGFFSNKPKPTAFFSIQKLIRFGGYALLSIFFFALPFWGLAHKNFISNFGSSIALWFGTFEFNASFYYVFRWLGFQLVGWNTIGTLGKILPMLIFLFILFLSFFIHSKGRKRIFVALLFGVSFYFFFSTTVHPWYIATPLLLAVFTSYKYTVVWSFVVMLSYAAYQQEVYFENLWLVAIEYVVVLGYLVYELLFLPQKSGLNLK